MADINKIRLKIDEVDSSITKLFEERMHLSEEVAAYKRENGLPTLNASREKEVVEQAVRNLEDKALEPYAKKLYEFLMNLSKDYQRSISMPEIAVGFQGIEGSFSHDACMTYIAKNPDMNYTVKTYDTFEGLCLALLNNEIERAVIPLENSSTGSVVDVYDLLLRYDYTIVGEIYVRVNHNLMAKQGTRLSDIKEVYSHSQAFMQSREFLDKYPFKQIPYKNTAICAQLVSRSERGDIACIASESAAKLYGLKILEHNINYNKNNYTKFVVLSKAPCESPDNDKISLITKLENTPGQLYGLTKMFSEHGINMTKIESRPDLNNPFEYIFFIDLTGNVSDENVQKALEILKTKNRFFKYLGNYRSFKL